MVKNTKIVRLIMERELSSSKNILLEAEDYSRKQFGKSLDSKIVQIFLSVPLFEEFAKSRGIPEDRQEVVIDEGPKTRIYIQTDLPENITEAIAYRVGQNGNLFFPFSGEIMDYKSHFCSFKSNFHSTNLIDLDKLKRYLESIPDVDLEFKWKHSPIRQRILYETLSFLNKDLSFLCRCSKGDILQKSESSSGIEKKSYAGRFITSKIISKKEGEPSNGEERLLFRYGDGQVSLKVSGNYSKGYFVEFFERKGCLEDINPEFVIKDSVLKRLREN